MDSEELLLAFDSLLLLPSPRYSRRLAWSFLQYPKNLEPMLEGPRQPMPMTRIRCRPEPTQSVRCRSIPWSLDSSLP